MTLNPRVYTALSPLSVYGIQGGTFTFYIYHTTQYTLLFAVGGLGCEFCVFVAGWRHALRSEWPFISLLLHTDWGRIPLLRHCSAAVISNNMSSVTSKPNEVMSKPPAALCVTAI